MSILPNFCRTRTEDRCLTHWLINRDCYHKDDKTELFSSAKQNVSLYFFLLLNMDWWSCTTISFHWIWIDGSAYCFFILFFRTIYRIMTTFPNFHERGTPNHKQPSANIVWHYYFRHHRAINDVFFFFFKWLCWQNVKLSMVLIPFSSGVLSMGPGWALSSPT